MEDRRLLSGTTPQFGATIAQENQLPGTPQSTWLVNGIGDPTLQGFSTEMNVNSGQTISFKINDTSGSAYNINIYRIGYYGGDGARLITTIPSSQTLVQNQPAPITNSSTGEVDAGNWVVSASWAVPSNALSGVYLAEPTRVSNGGASMIIFVVTNNGTSSDILFKTDDATWQAYNDWGGNSLYDGSPGTNPGRALAVSYNRPLNNYGNTSETNIHDEFFYAEYPMVRWLEANGYNVEYTTDVQVNEDPSALLDHKIFMAAGHDEYWSANEFNNVMAARNAGVNMAFFTGNEIFWKTYFAPSLDSSNTTDRTIVCYKETHNNGIIDPNNPTIWTGTWADPRFSPPADGGIGQNELTGTFFTVNTGADATGTPITVPGTDASLRFWRNTAVANLAPNQSMSIGGQVLGYEWDSDVDNGFRPAGLIDLSSTTQNASQVFVDWGNTVAPGTATHSLTLYRASSGALVFGAGTVQWSWGLDSDHLVADQYNDPDINMQQATMNLLADMGNVQPSTIQPGLVQATPSTDDTPPTSVITWPPAGTSLPSGTPVTITGTATDAGGGIVAGVEVSVDGGKTWHPAQGRNNWTYTWTPGALGQVTIMSRTTDDSANMETPSSGVSVNVTAPTSSLTIWGLGATPGNPTTTDSTASQQGVQLGVRFTSDIAGYITGIRFYKGTTNTGTHIGSLWTSNGQLLASATFTDESASGWQEVDFSTPVAIAANTTYVASYFAPVGSYAADPFYFALSGVNSGPLHVPLDMPNNPASVFSYGANTFPNNTSNSTNYWVDAVFSPTATITPRVVSATPLPSATGVSATTAITATFNESIQPNSVSFVLTDSQNNVVPATLSYDDTTHTVTLMPNAALSYPATYNVSISGATDSSGRVMSAPVSWSFSTSYQPGTTYSLWNNSVKPAVTSYTDTGPVEVGVQFTSAVKGTISGIRFYVGAEPPDSDPTAVTYTVHLWTSTGTLLGTASYSLNDDSSYGWQVAYFSTPVAIAANTTYIASYYSPEGEYAVTTGYFTNSGVTSGPLHALSNSEGANGSFTGNGVFTYGSGFPKSSFAGTNYWVDPVFNVNSVNTPPPTVTAVTPTSGSTGGSTHNAISATFSESVDPNSISISLVDASGNSINGSVAYNSSTNTVTLTPDGILNPSTQYTVTVKGATDAFGNVMTSPMSWSFTTTSTVTIWSSNAAPTVATTTDKNPIEVGIKFTTDVAGTVTGVRFYKGSNNTGTHIGHLWSANGTLLATATFTNETTSGWQQVNFSSPVTITPGQVYIVSYYAPQGGYAADSGYFNSSAVGDNLVVALSSAEGNGNGVYTEGEGFPTSSYNGTNYWVDVVFAPNTPSTPVPLTVTSVSPAANATSVPTISPITVTFSTPVQPGSIMAMLKDSQGNVVATTMSYDSTTDTATLAPNTALATGTQYTVTVSGATDVFNHTLSSPQVWSFTTTAQGTQTLWSPSATPSVVSANDSNAINVGVKFESTSPGYITGIRFYKGTSNTGTHVGYLWTNTGQLLASATFSSESDSGWQQVLFANPVAIAANTVYVASYYAPNGKYAADGGYFAGNSVNNGQLVAPSSATVNGNGVYLYGAAGQFPTQTYNGTNYWVDVVFDPGNVNTPAPTVVSETPASAAQNVSTQTSVTATFSEAVSASSINFTLTDSSGHAVAGTVAYNAATYTVSFTPNSPLNSNTQYTATVSGATDYYNHSLAAPVTWSFTTSATPTDTIWNASTAPSISSTTDTNAVELGVKFESSVAGYIDGIRFYKGTANTGTHIGNLWSSTGTLLASATFTNETASGWEQVLFSNPVAITANTVYVASYYAPQGGYAADSGYFSSSGVVNGPLQALSNSASGGNGVYAYGSDKFPTNSYGSTNYWVDVVFSPGSSNNPAPTVTAESPAPGAQGVSPQTTITATFSEAVQPSSINFTLVDSSNNVVAGSTSYNPTSQTVTFTPNAPLNPGTQYTVTISGVTDYNNQTISPPATWSFTTTSTPTYTFWNSSATPAMASVSDSSAVEVGVKFESSTAGFIDGIRFYKGSSNTGVHVGHLWTSTGTLLASVTFTNESAAGWEEADFSSPVAISANTVYVASYYAPVGGYSVTSGYFTNSGYTSGPIQALANSTAGGNGVFSYGNQVFPTSSYNASNYWVDVLFSTSTSASPYVVATTPASNATGVGISSSLSATFSEVINPNSVSATLTGPSGAISATLSYNSSNNILTITPTSALNPATTYTVTISGATDTSGNVMTPYSWSFTTDQVPTVTSVSPASSATSVPFGTAVTATFNEAIQASTLVFTLVGPNNSVVPATVSFNTTNNVATLQPNAALAANTTYTATISQASDAAGTALAAPVSWSFTTDTPPSVTAFTPASGATGVALGSAVTATFNEAIQAATLSFTLVGPNNTSVAATVSYNSTTNDATLQPNAPLAPGTTYTATINSANDTAGTALAAPVSWSFTTDTAPAVTAFTPASGATAIAPGTSLTATFNEAIQPSTLSFTLVGPNNTSVPATVTYNTSTNVATLQPNSPLAAGTTYTATISGASDAIGTTMTSPVSWSFTTDAPPTVTAHTPTSGATSVPLSTSVTATFNEAIQASTLVFTLVGPNNSTIPATVTYNASTNVATLQPTAPLSSNTVYTATVSGVSDTLGTTMTSPVSWSFTTDTPPVVTTFTPASSSMGVALGAAVTATFNEAIQGATLNFTLVGPNNTTVTATVTYNASTNVATLQPSSPLAPNTTYTATVSGANDLAGTPMAAPVSWSFITDSQPTVTSITPSSGATGVVLNTTVTATFSVPVQSSTVVFTLVGPNNTSVPATVTYNASTNTATLQPSSPLAAGTTYTATVSGAADAVGTTMSAPVTWSFTTDTAPSLTTFTPASGATGVALGSAVTATFNEAIQASTLSFTLVGPNNTSVPATVSYNSTTHVATLQPSSALAANTKYTVTVSGAKDTVGTQMVAPVTWSFTSDVIPAVTATTPAAGATSVTLGSSLTATFNEAIQASTLSFTLVGPNNKSVPATLSYNSTTHVATLQPNSPLAAGTTYTATVSGAKDSVGTAMTSAVTWSFTTDVAPAVTNMTPAAGSTLVLPTTSVSVTFNEAIVFSTLTFTLTTQNHKTVAATVTYNSTTHVATLKPTSTLSLGTTYIVTVSGATDALGTAMVAPVTWTFTTL